MSKFNNNSIYKHIYAKNQPNKRPTKTKIIALITQFNSFIFYSLYCYCLAVYYLSEFFSTDSVCNHNCINLSGHKFCDKYNLPVLLREQTANYNKYNRISDKCNIFHIIPLILYPFNGLHYKNNIYVYQIRILLFNIFIFEIMFNKSVIVVIFAYIFVSSML